jgi:hypothetical protein
MSVQCAIKKQLRGMGFTIRQAQAVIGIAKAAPECALVSGWWGYEINRAGVSVWLPQLESHVIRLAEIYRRAFL